MNGLVLFSTALMGLSLIAGTGDFPVSSTVR
jgi:hypothetical protein